MGIAENYDEVLKGKYPAKEHAKKVAEWLIANGGDKTGTIYLEAQKSKLNEVRCPSTSATYQLDFKQHESRLTDIRTMMARPLSGSVDTSTTLAVATSQIHTSHTTSQPPL